MTPQAARLATRRGPPRPASGLAPGYTQCNIIVLPHDLSWDFLPFAQRNPKPCPVLDATDPGSTATVLAPAADLSRDIPLYRIWRDGVPVDEVRDAANFGVQHPDLKNFLIGCSSTFDGVLMAAGISVAHVGRGCDVPMFLTDRDCRPAGRMSERLVASMRPIPAGRKAEMITASIPAIRGASVHVGAPEALGITDLRRPDFGDPVPVLWAYGVTPPFAITDAPDHIVVTDIPVTRWQA